MKIEKNNVVRYLIIKISDPCVEPFYYYYYYYCTFFFFFFFFFFKYQLEKKEVK